MHRPPAQRPARRTTFRHLLATFALLALGAQLPAARADGDAVSLEQDETGKLCKTAQAEEKVAWNAPTPAWAMALALAACAKQHQKLGNPGVMTALYPAFWAMYNALPEPPQRRAAPETAPAAPARRRIITTAVAVPPEMKEEDY